MFEHRYQGCVVSVNVQGCLFREIQWLDPQPGPFTVDRAVHCSSLQLPVLGSRLDELHDECVSMCYYSITVSVGVHFEQHAVAVI